MTETIGTILRDKGGVIWSVDPESTVYDALSTMAEKGIGAVLVTFQGRLVGVMSERDYARKIALLGRSSHDTRVKEIMSSSPVTVTPEHTVDECMRIMTHHRVRHLPVLEGDRLVGVISIGDLVNAIIADQARTIDHLHTYITGGYPA